jgi:hypothetical protein
MNHHALCTRPFIEEFRDFTRVTLHEQNVTWLATLDHVVEVQTQHRGEARRDSGRRSFGVRDRNTDLVAARLVALGFLARENDECRNQGSAPAVTRLPRAPG